MKKISIGKKFLSNIDVDDLDKFLNRSGLFYDTSLNSDHDLILSNPPVYKNKRLHFDFKVVSNKDDSTTNYQANIDWSDFCISYSGDMGSSISYFTLHDINFLIKIGYLVPIVGYCPKGKGKLSKTQKIKIDIPELKKLVESDLTVRALAEHFGCYSTTIYRCMKRHGIKSHNALQNIDVDPDKLVEMYLSGKNQTVCAEHFGCSRQNVKDILVSKGTEITPTGRAHLPNLEMYYKELGSMKACAAHYGCHVFIIGKRLIELGID